MTNYVTMQEATFCMRKSRGVLPVNENFVRGEHNVKMTKESKS